jgi:osmotically-inducible protein OsmY
LSVNKCSMKVHTYLIIIWFTLMTPAGFAASGQINDMDITLAVDTQLENDDGVPAHMIDVHTLDGVVTLSGSVPNLLARDRAADIAATVKGVRSIINRLEVRAVTRPDDVILREVEKALQDDPATDLFELDVTAGDGIVTLGEVDTLRERRAATQDGYEGGARKVRNRLKVRNAPAYLQP